MASDEPEQNSISCRRVWIFSLAKDFCCGVNPLSWGDKDKSHCSSGSLRWVQYIWALGSGVFSAASADFQSSIFTSSDISCDFLLLFLFGVGSFKEANFFHKLPLWSIDAVCSSSRGFAPFLFHSVPYVGFSQRWVLSWDCLFTLI